MPSPDWRIFIHSAEVDSAHFQPQHSSTGRRGYFANRGSVSARRQRQKREPRSDSTTLEWAQLTQRPGLAGSTPSGCHNSSAVYWD